MIVTATDDLDTTLNNLYSLRAGLSVISCFFDEAVKIISESNLEKIRYFRAELKDETKEKARDEFLNKFLFAPYSEEFGFKYWNIRDIYFDFRFAYFKRHANFYHTLDRKEYNEFEYPGTVLCDYWVHLDFFKQVVEHDVDLEKLRKSKLDEKALELERKYNELSAIHFFKRRQTKALINSIRLSFTLYDELLNFRDKFASFIEKTNRKLTPVVSKAREIYQSLVENYSQLLNERDWEYLDAVIYYFETGRAKTMQEALIQVDLQNRHEELIATIEHATSKICRTIEVNAHKIISQIKTSTAQLLDASAYQSALIEKSNTTSEELIEAAKQLDELLRI